MTNDSTNSAASPLSEKAPVYREAWVATAAAVLVIAGAGYWFYSRGFLLYYGDAQSHLSISRGIIDSRTAGYDQLGSVWLPVLHAIFLPFVGNDFLWKTGLAATFPVGACFVAATVLFYLTARDLFGSPVPAAVTAACFALNPNVLYLASAPMTEIVFFAGLALQMLSVMRYARTQGPRWLVVGAIASIWCSLTRYDGWFLIPFFTAAFLLAAQRKRFAAAVVFAAIAACGPLYWILHNQWSTGDALSFYRGPYSAKAIYERALAAGVPRDPGDGHWLVAAHYYFAAARLCSGWPLVVLGLSGMGFALWRRKYPLLLLLWLTPIFYIWSLHSSGNPIHVPHLYPFSWYNTRYGLAFVPLCAFGTGVIASFFAPGVRKWILVLPLIVVAPWLLHPSHQNWICWKESEQNSTSRRAWTAFVADYLREQYQPGDGILYSQGDVPGVFGPAGIHLSESLNPGNGPAYLVNAYRPDMVRLCKWAIIVVADFDPLARSIDKANWRRTVYQPVLEIHTKNDPVVRVYRRVW